MKTALSSSCLVVALAYKRCSRQHLDCGVYANQRHTTHLYASCGHKWYVILQGIPLAALGCQQRDDRVQVHKVPVHRTKGECLVAAVPTLKLGYFAFLLQLLGTLDSFVVEPIHLSRVSAASFDSKYTEMSTIVHRAYSDHSKFFLQPSAIGLICFFAGQILGICWWYQNYVGRFCWTSFILLCLLATLLPKRFVIYYLSIFGGPIYYCFGNRLYLIIPFD